MKFRTSFFVLAAAGILIAIAIYAIRRDGAVEEWEPGRLDSAAILQIDESGPRAGEALRSLEQHRWDEAISILRRALAENPQSAAAHYNLGILLLPTRNDEGRREIETALKLNKNYELATEALKVADKVKLR